MPSGTPLLYVVNLGGENVVAFVAKDTYRGCTIVWMESFMFRGAQGVFIDPCHGSRYTIEGECLYGRCLRHLDRVAVTMQRGHLYVLPDEITEGEPALRAERPLPPVLPGAN